MLSRKLIIDDLIYPLIFISLMQSKLLVEDVAEAIQNLQDPAIVADAIVYAAMVPRKSALQEMIITPLTETSWP